MSEPLTSEERDRFAHYAESGKGPSSNDMRRWWEGYLALLDERDRLRGALERPFTCPVCCYWPAYRFCPMCGYAPAPDLVSRGVR